MTHHSSPSPLAGQTVRVKPSVDKLGGNLYVVEDWWDRVAGKSWMWSDGNPACLHYAIRSAAAHLPTDDEVLYGKVDGLGHLIHASELE